jgi:hypothetical protein
MSVLSTCLSPTFNVYYLPSCILITLYLLFLHYSSSIAPVPQVYPFSRTGYYGLIPEDQAPPDPPKPATYTVAVSAGEVA